MLLPNIHLLVKMSVGHGHKIVHASIGKNKTDNIKAQGRAHAGSYRNKVVCENQCVSMLLMMIQTGACCSLSLLTFFCVLLALKKVKVC